MHSLRSAFTIIEILISVIIISFGIIYVLRLHSDNEEQIVYLSERNKNALQDSLFLSTNALRYHKEKKAAYDILENQIKVKESQSREILKETDRNIFIPEEIEILPPPETPGPTAIVNEIKLKGDHSSIYWHFKIQSF